MAKIVVIDDDESTLLLVRGTFQSGGHEVVASSDPSRAVELCEDPAVDAAIFDVMLPGDTAGWDLLQEIRNNPITEQMPVVLLSSLSNVNDRVRGIRIGADDYLTKPFHPEELLARVEALISRKATHLSGHQGRLEAQSISEIVQSLEQNARSGMLEVATRQSMGRVVVRQGKLLTADFEGLRGPEAFLAMAELDTGLFRFFPSQIRQSDLDDSRHLFSFQPLLLDAAWIVDELRERELPRATQVLEAGGPIPQLPGAYAAIPVAAVAARIQERRPASLGGLLQQKLAAPNKVRLAVTWLIEHDAVRIAARP